MSQSRILLESGTNELEIVEFFLDEQMADGTVYRGYYGINVAKVLEIIRVPHITSLPDVNHVCVKGAFNLRSHIIPLVDLSVWLDKEPAEVEQPKVIVTEFNDINTAFIVSGVNRIHRISWEEVEPPNQYVAKLTESTVTGVVRLEDRIIFLLDLERIVADLNPTLGLQFNEEYDWESSNSYHAIIADDSQLIREMLRGLLEKANFSVESFTNGSDAWARLYGVRQKALEEKNSAFKYVQVVVSDIEMPSMDGHSLCKRIKDDTVLKDIPVILFSSLITDRLRHKGEAVGADEQMSKPVASQLAHRAYEIIEDYRKKLGLE